MNRPSLAGMGINTRLLTMVAILVGLWLFFRVLIGEFYFSGESIAKLSRDMASWTILAAGMTLVIVSGHIDLSVGSLLALVAATGALLMNPEYGPGLPAAQAVPLAVGCGTILGALQGALIAYVRVPSFIVTLGGMFVFRGITQKVSAFDPRVPDASWVATLGFDYLPPSTGTLLGIVASVVLVLLLLRGRLQARRLHLRDEHVLVTCAKGAVGAGGILGFIVLVNQYRGVPYQTLVMVGVILVLGIVAQRTVLGRHLYAIGGNPAAARLSGVRVERRVLAVFTIMGFVTGIAGIVWMAQNQGSTKNAGQFYELYAIAAAVIGGASLMGGRGTILGTLLGGLVMATVIQGMDYTNLENWLQLVVRGGVLVIAVAIDSASTLKRFWRSAAGPPAPL